MKRPACLMGRHRLGVVQSDLAEAVVICRRQGCVFRREGLAFAGLLPTVPVPAADPLGLALGLASAAVHGDALVVRLAREATGDAEVLLQLVRLLVESCGDRYDERLRGLQALSLRAQLEQLEGR